MCGAVPHQREQRLVDHPRGYPALLISFREDVLIDTGDKRVDGLVAVLSGAGWHAISAMDVAPGHAPDGWCVRFTVTDLESGRGDLELINPTGEVETEASVYDAQGWMLGVQHLGASAVIMGLRYLSNWLVEGTVAATERAGRAGRLVGGIVPVTLRRAQ